MPAKKKAVEESKTLLGRPGNTLKMGIVGVPNVGKSSTFNLLSNLSIPAENYPFCTIDPNEARVAIPDQRFDRLCQMYTPKSMVAASLSITDIAGLVRGASEGAGLGNAFLSHINAVDGIYQIVRAFNDPEVIHTEGEVDPIRDLEIIQHELCVKDIERANNRIEELEKILKRSKDKDLVDELELMKKCREMLQNDQSIRYGEWSNKEVETLNRILFLTAKTVVYMVNLSSQDYLRKKNKWLQGINNWVQAHGGGSIIPYSIEFEQAIFGMGPEEKSNYLKENNAISMVNRIIKTGYHALNLIHFFTAGEDEVKCWTVRQGSKAPKAAGVIHTDFEKGFICAEVMKYDDLISLGSEAQVKADGKMKQCGKDYVVEDGDVIYFRFNVTSAPKGK
jgi:obg-like ATPase 1